ncbi:MAG: phosphoribosylglycinamide formyltransferase [Planctomycetota bacterium]
MNERSPIAVLLSGSGSTLQNLIDHGFHIAKVVSSRPGVRGIERAEAAGIATTIVERKTFGSDEAFSDAVFAECEGAGLICMAGWLRKVVVPAAWEGRVLNVHPSLLPAFGGPGMFGHHVHAAVLERGCKITGCTVHLVNNALDEGPILAQQAVEVADDETPESLANKVQSAERELYPRTILAYQQQVAMLGKLSSPKRCEITSTDL